LEPTKRVVVVIVVVVNVVDVDVVEKVWDVGGRPFYRGLVEIYGQLLSGIVRASDQSGSSFCMWK